MQTTTDISTLDERLRDYARLLQANGFRIYLKKWKPWNSMGGTTTTLPFFSYSQTVDGIESFGSCEIVGPKSFSHRMPVDNSSGHIWVDGVPDEMTVDAARKIAQPVNRGKHEWGAGIHANHSILDRLYGDDYILLAPADHLEANRTGHDVHIRGQDNGKSDPMFRAECECGWRGPFDYLKGLAITAGERHVLAPWHSTDIHRGTGQALPGNRYSGDIYYASCSCGWQGPKQPLESEADAMATLHIRALRG